MSIKNMDIKVYRANDFGKVKIKLTKDNKYINQGKVELCEYAEGKIYNGAFGKIDTVNQTFFACYYDDNNLVGPRLDCSQDSFEFAYSNGNEAYTGYRIKYINNTCYLGFYSKGNFTGRMIVISKDGKISFATGKKFLSVNESKYSGIDCDSLKYEDSIRRRLFYFEDENHKSGYNTPIVYKIDGKTLYGKGLMHCSYLHSDLDVNRIEDINSTYKFGYGFYPFNDDSYFLGYVNRRNVKGFSCKGFSGPCIYRINEANIVSGFFKEDMKNDLCLLSNFKDHKYEIAIFENDKRNGFSFLVTADGVELATFKNDSKTSNDIFIDCNCNVKVFKNNKLINEVPFSLFVDESLVEEEKLNNEDYDFEKAKAIVKDKIEKEYKDFEYTIDFEKKVKDGVVYANAKVNITKYIGDSFYVIIPERTISIAQDAFVGASNKLTRIVFRNKHLLNIQEGSFKYFTNLKSLEFDKDVMISKICKESFFNTRIEEIHFPRVVQRIETGAFENCHNLVKVFVSPGCVIEDGAFPPKCAIFYENLIFATKEDKKIYEEKNKLAQKTLKENKKQFEQKLKNEKKKEAERKQLSKLSEDERLLIMYEKLMKTATGFKKDQYKKMYETTKLRIEKSNKNKNASKKSTPKTKNVKTKTTRVKSSNGFVEFLKKVGNVVVTILTSILDIILFIPRKIFSFFSEGEKSIVLPYILSTFSIIVGIVTLILGFCGVLDNIEDFFSMIPNNLLPNLYGYRLLNLYNEFVDGLKANGLNVILSVILTLFYAVVGTFEFLLNALVFIVILVCYLIYIIYGFGFIFGLGVVLIVPPVISLIKSEEKIYPLISLVFSIIITIIYYIFMYSFYFI